MSSWVYIQRCLLAYELFPLTSKAVTSIPVWNTTILSSLPVPLRITAQHFTIHSQCYLWQIKKKSYCYESWQNLYPFACLYCTLLLVYIEYLKVMLFPALTDSIHMSRFLFQDDKPSSHFHFDALSTCTTEPVYLSCPVPYSEVFMYRSHDTRNISIYICPPPHPLFFFFFLIPKPLQPSVRPATCASTQVYSTSPAPSIHHLL